MQISGEGDPCPTLQGLATHNTRLQLGKANKIIAFDLGMSESTVKVHVRNIMRKMGATDRTQAAFAGYRQTDGTTGSQWASA
jgi:Bacterial regulatory proteins, luxR family